MIHMDIRNLSTIKRLYTRGKLEQLAEKICRNEATDVLSFEQESPKNMDKILLGDIVISLETVQRYCGGDRDAMRTELNLLFCHGLLHLLGYDHGKKADKLTMQQKQAEYLGIGLENVWH